MQRKILTAGAILFFTACAGLMGPSRNDTDSVQIIKEVQGRGLKNSSVEDLNVTFSKAADDTATMLKFFEEVKKSGAHYLSNLQITIYTAKETCVSFLMPIDELKNLRVTQTGALATHYATQPLLQLDNAALAAYSPWKLATSRPLCETTNATSAGGKVFGRLQAKIYVPKQGENRNQALD